MRSWILLPCALAQLVVQQADEGEIKDAVQKLLFEAQVGNLQQTASNDGIKQPTLCDPKVKQHSGYLAAASGNQYFFWLFESRSKPAADPLIMWLNGGPGCSSLMGLLSENGPCKVNDAGETVPNAASWNEHANVIYVDQPAQTGFSKGSGLAHNEDGVAANMVAFIQSFYAALPQYKPNDFYLFGESYGGHYVPAISHAIWADKTSAFKVPLKGIGIGNGLVDPAEQYKWYAQMAFDGGKGEGGTLAQGVITNPLAQGLMKAAIGPCVKAIDACNGGSAVGCEKAFMLCNYGEQVPYRLTGMNPYDMRIKCEHGNLCYDFTQVDKYLNKPDVQEALGARGRWSECNMAVNLMFQQDFMKNYHQLLPDMLKGGIKVLIYAGDCDFICNWLGNKHWALAMEWDHQKAFATAEDAAWRVQGKEAGRVRAAAGFTFMQIYQAGHMVPMDQPDAALQMVREFTGTTEREEEVLV